MFEVDDLVKWMCYDTSPPVLLDGRVLRVLTDDKETIYRISVDINGKSDPRWVREQLLKEHK